MSEVHNAVKGVSRKDLRRLTRHLRKETGVDKQHNFCVVRWLEVKLLPLIGFELDIVEPHVLGEDHAVTLPQDRIIYIREDIYHRAISGYGRDRGTVIHEVGHALLHTPDRWLLARKFQNDNIPAYNHPEWQAKAFAGEFLVPVEQLKLEMTAKNVAKHFGVSIESALYQIKQYEKEGLIKINGSAKADPKIVWMK